MTDGKWNISLSSRRNTTAQCAGSNLGADALSSTMNQTERGPSNELTAHQKAEPRTEYARRATARRAEAARQMQRFRAVGIVRGGARAGLHWFGFVLWTRYLVVASSRSCLLRPGPRSVSHYASAASL